MLVLVLCCHSEVGIGGDWCCSCFGFVDGVDVVVDVDVGGVHVTPDNYVLMLTFVWCWRWG